MDEFDDSEHFDDDEEIDPDEVYDLTQATVQEYLSKDRTTASIRFKDPSGLCDMKILLLYRLKVHQMEVFLGIHDEHGERH